MTYTSIKQSEKLLELGLSPESADMFYPPCVGNYSEYPELDLLGVIDDSCLPCWSVGALLELMSDIPDCTIIFAKAEGKYGMCITPMDSGLALNEIEASAPTEACYNMILWLLENGYIKKGE